MNKQMVLIRALTGEDAPACWDLRLLALESEPQAFLETVEEHRGKTPGEMAERIRSGLPRDVLFGAFATGHLVGVVGFYLDKDRQGWVWGMFVHPEFRGQGLGRRLLSEIVQHARSLQDLRELHLMVASSQKPALGLYESCGFSPHAGPFPEGYRGGKCDRHLVLRIVREARAI